MKFTHKVSKGGRFNQIYIPREAEQNFEVGDLVEVRLLKKKTQLYYSKTLPKLSEFKEKLIKDIFFIVEPFKEINQIFLIGSFLTQKIDYHDIDIIIINKQEDLEEKVYNKLISKFDLKFHIIQIPKDNLLQLMEICPLTKSMFYYHISNKKFNIILNERIDKNHIKFLLMLPEDLLEIKTNSRSFYDCIRRLITIEKFLEKKEINPLKINEELKQLIDPNILLDIQNNEIIEKKTIEKLRNIIKEKLNKIKGLIRNG